MVVFRNLYKTDNEIKLSRHKMNWNNREMKNHPWEMSIISHNFFKYFYLTLIKHQQFD